MKNRKKHSRRRKRHIPKPRGVEVGPTRIGTGVFATWDFDEEDRISEFGGEVVDDPNHESDYCIELAEGQTLEPVAPLRFLNHSCDPNCELAWDEVDGEVRVYLDTLRPISFGEELTIDYAWPRECAIPCQCQSAWCRGWVVDEEELPLLLAEQAELSELTGRVPDGQPVEAL